MLPPRSVATGKTNGFYKDTTEDEMENCCKDVDVRIKNVWIFIEFQTIRIPTERLMPFLFRNIDSRT